MSEGQAVQNARERFPRGLAQPEDGYRFSIDSLLLAAFARNAGARVLDLGCGCGVVGLAMLLDAPGLRVTGLEADPELADCAGQNAVRLGFGETFELVRGNVAGIRRERPVKPESFDAVVANPPYRDVGSGRIPTGGRLAARFEAGASLEDFIRAGAFGLKNKGRFFMVYLPERMAALFAALAACALEPKRLRFAHGTATEPAKILLVEARKNGGPGLSVEPPLILHESGRMTDDALAFCPALGCNPGGS